jgi:hypothetical protein
VRFIEYLLGNASSGQFAHDDILISNKDGTLSGYRDLTAWLGMSDSNSETSSQIMPLKARADSPTTNSGHGDHSPLSCSAGIRSSGGWVLPESALLGHHSPRRDELAGISFDQKMIR